MEKFCKSLSSSSNPSSLLIFFVLSFIPSVNPKSLHSFSLESDDCVTEMQENLFFIVTLSLLSGLSSSTSLLLEVSVLS